MMPLYIFQFYSGIHAFMENRCVFVCWPVKSRGNTLECQCTIRFRMIAFCTKYMILRISTDCRVSYSSVRRLLSTGKTAVHGGV